MIHIGSLHSGFSFFSHPIKANLVRMSLGAGGTFSPNQCQVSVDAIEHSSVALSAVRNATAMRKLFV